MELALGALNLLLFFSPPFLLAYAWKRHFAGEDGGPQPRWRRHAGLLNLILLSILLAVCLVKLATHRCNADIDWSCVAAWRDFTRIILVSAPAFLLFSLFSSRGTRIPSFLFVLAVSYDCILIDMAA